ncbi:hypothetical protein LguiB_015742 [Lonicera macranthoides]
MAYSSSTVEGNSSNEVDVRFVLKQCECGEVTDVKIAKSNKNNNRGRMYYSCKRQRCGTFLGWCNVSSIQVVSSTVGTLEECSTSRASIVGEPNTNNDLKVRWKFLIVLCLMLTTYFAVKVMKM